MPHTLSIYTLCVSLTTGAQPSMQQSYEHDQKFLQLLSPPRFACCCCCCYRLQIWRLPKSISLVQYWGQCSFGNLGSYTHRRTHAYWAHANQASAHRKVCNTFCALPIEWQQSKQAKAATSWRVANSAKVSPTPPPPLSLSLLSPVFFLAVPISFCLHRRLQFIYAGFAVL